MENGFRQVRTGSAEQTALVAQGYSVHEDDGTTTILTRARRATDQARRVTGRDLARYRSIEHGVLEQLAAELTAVGHPVDAGQLRWVLDEFRARVMRESKSSRTVVSGRLR